MTVFLEGRDNKEVKECKKNVAMWRSNNKALLKADMFMFMNRILEDPFHIDNMINAIK